MAGAPRGEIVTIAVLPAGVVLPQQGDSKGARMQHQGHIHAPGERGEDPCSKGGVGRSGTLDYLQSEALQVSIEAWPV